MRKLLLLLTGGLFAITANGQYMQDGAATIRSQKAPFLNAPIAQKAVPPMHHSGARTTSAAFWSDGFGSIDTSSGLPIGWTTGVITGTGTWHWTQVASSSLFSIGTIASSTASNGWMIFDSDSLGSICSCAPQGWLQSPVINCLTHPTVKLSFQEKFKDYNDSCYIWVSNDSGATWTPFSVLPNNSLAKNAATANPKVVSINISSIAAGDSAVVIRFVYNGAGATGGGYSWLVDDVSMSQLDSNDVGISGSFMYEPEATAYNGSIFTTPLAFVDTFFPTTLLTNYGAVGEANIPVTATIYSGTTPVYTQTLIYPNLPVNAYDSVVQFTVYKPGTIGNYTCAITASDSADAVTSNNLDSVFFNVSDTTWQENLGPVTGAYYLYNSGTGASYMQGTRFDVPSSSAGDTVSGFGVAFSSVSAPTNTGGLVSVQLYSIQKGSTGWTYVGSSVARPLRDSDISTAGAEVWADFRIDASGTGGITPFILQHGTTYAAVVQVNGVTTDLLADATDAPAATGFAGYFGQTDTSLNNGAATFSPASAATGNTDAVPMVRMYFGPALYATAVNHVKYMASVGNPYPDPANASVSVPFTIEEDATVTATLTNTIGQVVNVQNVRAVTGQPSKATFNTTSLPDGVYIYTLQADGERSTGKVVITH